MPTAYGLAPVEIIGPGAVLAAAGPGEAVWLGLQAVEPAHPVSVRVRVDGRDAVTGESWEEGGRDGLSCPPDYCLPGLRVAAGHLPFTAGELTVFLKDPARAQVSIRIVHPDRFTEATGRQVAPLDPGNAYEGRRLP